MVLVSYVNKERRFSTETQFPQPGDLIENYFLDLGPLWESKRIIDNQSPVLKGTYRILVPRTDADGNDLGWQSLHEVMVPIAVYTPWNLNVTSSGG